MGNGDGVGWGGMGDTLILDISDVTAITDSISVVVHNLDAAVGKGHPVVSSHGCAIGSLVLAKVGAGVLVLNAILESIGLGWLSVSVSGGVDRSMDDRSVV